MVLALLLAPAPAQASFLDSLGNLWSSGTQKLGELFDAGKEKVGSLLGGDKPSNTATTPDLGTLLTQIEAAQEAVGGKADNVAGYLDRLGPSGPGEASRPFLAERVRDLSTTRNTLDQLYGQLQPTLSATRGGTTLSAADQKRIGEIQRQQQILVASTQRIDGQVQRFEIASQNQSTTSEPSPAATNGPVPPAPTQSTTTPVADSPISSSDLPSQPVAPTSTPEAPPTELEQPPATISTATEDQVVDPSVTVEGDVEDGVTTWGSSTVTDAEVEAEPVATPAASTTSDGTIIKADSAEAFGGVVEPASETSESEEMVIKADAVDDFGGVVDETQIKRTEADDSESETEYGSSSRPEEDDGAEADSSGGVPALTASEDAAPKVFHPDDPEMGPWIDEWLAAVGLDTYGRYVSPSNISARGSSDTGSLSRRAWVHGRVKDWNAGTNFTLAAYIEAKMNGESPSIIRKTDPFGGPLGGAPAAGTSAHGSRDLPSTTSGGAASAGAAPAARVGMDDASYRRLLGAIQTGDQGAIREAYPGTDQ